MLTKLSAATIMVTTALAAQTVYIGARSNEGIYRMEFDPATGAIRDVKVAGKTVNPTFVAVHPKRPLVFAVVAAPEGKVSSFAIEADGQLRLLNEVSSKGQGPAHVQIDRTGQWVSTANFGSGSVAVYKIQSDGKLSEAVDSAQHAGKGPHATRQAGPHAHSTYFSADNKWMYAADLGIDEVKVYGFDAKTGKLTAGTPLKTPAGAGPRHLALGKKRVYVLNEIASSVSVFEKGKLLETVNALPEGFTGSSSSAEVVIDKAEKFLYASNRGANTIAVFRIEAKGLKKVGDVKVGAVPRGFVLSPDGRFLIAGAQDENTIQVYRVDAKTGLLTAVGDAVKANGPICFRFRVS
jgi:6-phosphogluconolactonase